jgi:hypothetical protein
MTSPASLLWRDGQPAVWVVWREELCYSEAPHGPERIWPTCRGVAQPG